MTSIESANLAQYLKAQRWFGGKAWPIKNISVVAHAPLQDESLPAGTEAQLGVVDVSYELGNPERYLLAIAFSPDGELVDALGDDRSARLLLDLIRQDRSIVSGSGTLKGERLAVRADSIDRLGAAPKVRRIVTEQSNTSLVFDERVILKVIRKLEPGLNPEYEIGRFLSRAGFTAAPALLGALQLEGQAGTTLALLHEFTPDSVDGWSYMLDAFRAQTGLGPKVLGEIAQLGERLGELHLALASDAEDPAFAPEPIQLEDLQRWSASIIGELGVTLADASERFPQALHRREDSVNRAKKLTQVHPSGKKIRIHGDLHLGQVLHVPSGWSIFDFEGEPSRRFVQRREKQSPLKDVAGMMRSFAYAATTVQLEGKPVADQLRLAQRSFLEAYQRSVQGSGLLPERTVDSRGLLDAFELEKLLYELRYELHNRPDWARIPMEALMHPETSL